MWCVCVTGHMDSNGFHTLLSSEFFFLLCKSSQASSVLCSSTKCVLRGAVVEKLAEGETRSL